MVGTLSWESGNRSVPANHFGRYHCPGNLVIGPYQPSIMVGTLSWESGNRSVPAKYYGRYIVVGIWK